MNNKSEQALTDALVDQIESAARASFRHHQGSIKGQDLTAADHPIAFLLGWVGIGCAIFISYTPNRRNGDGDMLVNA